MYITDIFTVVSFSFWKHDKEKLQDYVFLFQNFRIRIHKNQYNVKLD